MKWIQRLFHPPEIRALKVSFEMEETEAGLHEVKVFKSVEDQRLPVKDFAAFARYGYTEERREDGRVIIYRLEDEDILTLLALKSMNPEVASGGRLIFEVLPPQLEYLRARDNVVEGARSRAITISKEAVKPVVDIAFDPATGLEVQAGYRNAAGALVRESDLHKTPDGQYARLKQRFIRLPPDLSAKTRQLLEQGQVYVPPEMIPEFFLRDLALLQEECQAVLRDGAEDISVYEEMPSPTIKIDVDTPGWLEFEVEYDVHGVQFPHSALPKRSTPIYHRVDEATWVKIAGDEQAAIDQKLDNIGALADESGRYRLPAAQFASLEEFVTSIGGTQEATAAYETYLSQLTQFQSDAEFQLTPEMESMLQASGMTLRPYQRAGIHWLDWLCRNQLHGVLADDMGLGKTIQAICVLRLAYERTGAQQHSLVVAPRSVLLHWEREIQRCFPDVRVYRYHGPARRPALLHIGEPLVFITTYSTAVKDKDELSLVPFFYIILDEASYIKNPHAKRSQAMKKLNATHRLALSGTPVENRPAEIWSIFDFLMRGHLGRYGTFRRIYEKPILDGDQAASAHLGRRVKPFVLRRLKEEVAPELPPKIELTEWCELAEEQRQLYGGLQDKIEEIRGLLQSGAPLNYTANILPVLTRLKQICDHPAIVTQETSPLHGRSEKFDWIVNKVLEIHQRDEQVVVFSQFLSMLDLLEAALKKRAIDYVRLDGSTQDRQHVIDVYTTTGVTVALCSLRATCFGINLQAANHVIHADRWWNPAVEDQATDRVHRIGQDDVVYVYRILNEGTLEERIDHLLAAKRVIAKNILDATDQSQRVWTREELIEILQPLDTQATSVPPREDLPC